MSSWTWVVRRVERSVRSPIGPNEWLFTRGELAAGGEENLLQQSLGVTTREAEVLLWVSRGKANRDIGEILQISPRTVKKHLEQVFVKLGVGTRASAAARAVHLLSRQREVAIAWRRHVPHVTGQHRAAHS